MFGAWQPVHIDTCQSHEPACCTSPNAPFHGVPLDQPYTFGSCIRAQPKRPMLSPTSTQNAARVDAIVVCGWHTVRVLPTTKPSDTACRMLSLGPLCGSSARTSSRKGGFRPDRMASELSVTCRSCSGTLPSWHDNGKGWQCA